MIQDILRYIGQRGAGNVHVTVWRLSSIAAPNGNKVTFNYDKGVYLLEPTISYSYTPTSRYYGSAEEDPTISYERRTFCGNYFNPLVSVDVNGHMVLSFEWEDEDTSTDECAKENFIDGILIASYYTTEGPFPLKVKKRHLKGINLFNWYGTKTDDCVFKYGALGSVSGVRKRLLKEVSSLSKGKYSFGYKMPVLSLPPHDGKNKDMWGYWSAGVFDPRQYRTYDSLIDQLQYLNCAVPDYERTMTGALTLVTYPTGGTSRIVYEQNTASSGLEVDGTSVPGVKSLYTYNVPIGGLRVRSIENDAKDGMSDSISYTYYDNYDVAFGGPSSGVAMNIPRLSFEMSYLRYSSTVGNRVYLNGSHSGSLGYSTLVSTFYLPSLPVFWTCGPQVTYKQVQEHFENGAVVNHIFTSYIDFPDIYGDSFVVAGTTDIAPLSNSQATRMWLMMCSPVHDRSALRWHEKTVSEYDNTLSKVKETVRTYTPNQSDMLEADCNDVLFWERHSILRYEPRLEEVASKSFEKTESGRSVCFENVASYTYNIYNQLSGIIRTAGSRNDRTDYLYSWETGASGKSNFRAAVKEVTCSVNGLYVDRVEYGYDNSVPCLTPKSVYKYIYDRPVSNKGSYDRINVSGYEYDNMGRMTKANLPGGAYVAFEWDTDGRHIIRKTENTDSQVTGYSWSDQIGLSSITFPSGQKETYTYDGKGRLSFVRNTFGEKTRRYEVLLASESASSSSVSNYVREYSFLSADGVGYVLDANYYNGLGYLNLMRRYGYASSREDLVCPIVYDDMRRPGAREYLPFPAISVGSVADAIQKQRDWYHSNYVDSIAYRETAYERTVSGRPLSSRNAGERYKRLDKKRMTKYGVNSAADCVYVLSYGDDGHIECTGVSLPETLRKQTFISEDADTSIVFSDILGREILSRQLESGRRHDTYRIYDERDSLVCVISPKGSEMLGEGVSFGPESVVMEGLSYRYRYDGQGRLIEYRSPGGGLSAFAYDRRDRLVFFQDANMAYAGKGKYYLYDSANRVVEEGVCVPKTSIEGIRSSIIYGLDIESLTEDRTPTRQFMYYGGNGVIPDYFSFEEEEGIISDADTSSLYCRGALRYEKVYEVPYYRDESNLFASGLYEERAYWYDRYGRVVQSLALSSDGWYRRDSYKYDFIGNILAVNEKVATSGRDVHSLTTIYERDSRGRVLSYDRVVDGVSLKNIRYEYDKLGQLAGKYAYGADASSPVLSQSYAYSIQGWMKRNSVRASYGNIFDESLVRDSEGRAALFSGRIRSAEYRHLDDLQMRDEYCYDHLGRLTGSRHFEDGHVLHRGIESDIRYDANGNITSLVRFNEREEAEPRRFDYNGNRRVEYQYDRNGNIISFGNANIFNLPYEQGFNTYKYLSDGMKFEKRDTSGKGLRYSGAFVFNLSSSSQASAESAAFPEGRICFKDGWKIVDEWYVKDHVGSVRSIVDLGASVVEEAILFQSDYSPYGRRVVTVRREDTEGNRYGFSGKESSIGGDPDVFLDFGARYWSPVFYTWLSCDPKADSYCSVSPYVYCAGDPVNFVDPDGEDWYEINYFDDASQTIQKRYKWTYYTSQEDLDNHGVDARYLGEAVILFRGSLNEKLSPVDSTLTGPGAVAANVIILGINSPFDMKRYHGLSVSSNPEKYPMLAPGEYRLYQEQMSSSKYKIKGYNYRITKMNGDVNVDPVGGYNKATGLKYIEGEYLHRTNLNGNAYYSSHACLNIDGREWEDVDKQLGVSHKIYMLLTRD